MWANLHLLFWLSLVPFSTAWMGEHRFAADPDRRLRHRAPLRRDRLLHPPDRCCSAPKANSPCCAPRSGTDVKGKLSPLLYCIGIGFAFVDRWIALAVYVGVALTWLVPDRRLERHVSTAAAKLRRVGAQPLRA